MIEQQEGACGGQYRDDEGAGVRWEESEEMQPVSHAPRPATITCPHPAASALTLMRGTGLPLSPLHHAMVQISQFYLYLCLSMASWEDTTSTPK